MRIITLLAALSVTPWLAADAFAAAPTAQQQEDIKAKLMAVAQSEKDLVDTIVAGLDAQNPLPVSASAKADYATAKTLKTEAETLWGQKKYKDAYMKYREATMKLMPAMNETLALNPIPAGTASGAQKAVEVAGARIDALANAVANWGTADAKTTYADAKASYTSAKSLWDAGTKKDAATKAFDALTKCDKAVKEMFDAYMASNSTAPAPAPAPAPAAAPAPTTH